MVNACKGNVLVSLDGLELRVTSCFAARSASMEASALAPIVASV